MNIAQTLRDIKRLNQIANVLFKLELDNIIERLKPKSYMTLGKRFKKQKREKDNPKTCHTL